MTNLPIDPRVGKAPEERGTEIAIENENAREIGIEIEIEIGIATDIEKEIEDLRLKNR